MFHVVSTGVLLAASLAASPGDVVVRPVEGDATAVLQRALDRCFRAGGGTVTVEKGEYAVRGLRLRSRTTLLLKSGAVLKGSRNCEAYEILADDKIEPVPQADFAPGVVWVTLSLSLKDCRLSFATRQKELVRAAHVESLELDGVTVEGVEGPCVRSWGGVVEPSVRALRGVEPKVVDADVPFRVKPI